MIGTITLLTLLASGPAAARPAAPPPPAARPATGDTAPVDYASPASWLCRPEAEDLCVRDLDADAIDADGRRTTVAFAPPRDPGIDCFYVYPAISPERTFYASLDPAPLAAVVRLQAARLRDVCRVYAPIYHQVTMAGLTWQIAHDGVERSMAGVGAMERTMHGIPARDVEAAWRHYLDHDNRGRGVVLIGHSQGAIILKKLIADQKGFAAIRDRLVGTYLAGNPDFGTADLHGLPLCARAGQLGCVVAFSTYPEGYDGPRLYGQARRGRAICVNPAAPGAPSATIDSAFTKRDLWKGTPPPDAPRSDRPFVIWSDRLAARCDQDARGAVLRVRPAPGAAAAELPAQLDRIEHTFPPNWGLHGYDVQLSQISLIGAIGDQRAAFLAQRPRPPTARRSSGQAGRGIRNNASSPISK